MSFIKRQDILKLINNTVLLSYMANSIPVFAVDSNINSAISTEDKIVSDNTVEEIVESDSLDEIDSSPSNDNTVADTSTDVNEKSDSLDSSNLEINTENMEDFNSTENKDTITEEDTSSADINTDNNQYSDVDNTVTIIDKDISSIIEPPSTDNHITEITEVEVEAEVNLIEENKVEDDWVSREVARQVYGSEDKYTDLLDSDYLKITDIYGYKIKPKPNHIPSTIGKLKNLKTLDITYWDLSGGISEELGNLQSLETLALYNCNLSGEIPSFIYKLTNLKKLELAYNSLEGEISEDIGNLSKLETLRLYNNNLTGNIPNNISKLSNAISIELHENNLTGSIPESIVNLKKLASLRLYENKLSGTIPDMSSMNLYTVDIASNNFSGEIPAHLFKIPNATILSLANNNFTGNFPVIPTGKSITTLNLSGNNLSGEIPESIGNIKGLNYLNLDNNSFTGSIPNSIGNLSTLTFLHLNNNNLSGTIPSSLGNLKSLTTLNLSNNNFTGEVIPTINKLTSINAVSLNNNNFTGDLSTLNNLTNLMDDYYSICGTNFKNNLFTGSVPSYITDRIPNDKFHNNFLENMEGQYTIKPNIESPVEIKLSEKLDTDMLLNSFVVLDTNNNTVAISPLNLELVIDNNTYLDTDFNAIKIGSSNIKAKISGTNFISDEAIAIKVINNQVIEDDWVNREVARQVYGSEDKYTDLLDSDYLKVTSIHSYNMKSPQNHIPVSISKLKNLKALSLKDWDLSSGIPSELSELKSLNSLSLYNCNLSGEIPNFIYEFKDLTDLTLASNKLSGEIPDNIKNLTKLKYLSLHNNNLSGNIPESICELSSLTQIYLNNNSLSGEIPRNLQNLTELITIHMDENSLSGSIPNLTGLDNLVAFTCGDNNLSGEIPASLFELNNINTINLNNNSFYGKLPASNIKSTIRTLSLNNNQLIGDIPNNFKNIRTLTTDNNLLNSEDNQKQLVFSNTTPINIYLNEKVDINHIKNNIKLISTDKSLEDINSSYSVSISSSDESILDNELTGVSVGSSNLYAKINEVSSSNLNGTTNNTISVSVADNIAPTLQLSLSNTNWSNSNVDINVSANDNHKISKITLPDGSNSSMKEFKYNISSNGDYTFIAYDMHNNRISKTITANNIDKQRPSLVINESSLKNDNTIDITIHTSDSNSGLDFIKINGENVSIKESQTINIKDNGIYKILVGDKAGNTIEESIKISGIKDISIKDTQKPKMSYILSNTSKTNEDVLINVLATDNKEVKEIIGPDGSKVIGDAMIYTAKENGIYNFKAVDINNNSSLINININNIDKSNLSADVVQSELLPDNTINLVLDINKNTRDLNTINVNGNISLDTETTTLNVDKNGTYQFYIEDVAQNTTIASTVVDKIPFSGDDTEAPEINYVLDNYNWSCDSENIFVYAVDNHNVKSITLPNGNVIEDSSFTYEASDNGIYTFVAEDLSGNKSSIKVEVNNLDLIAPSTEFNVLNSDEKSVNLKIKSIDSQSGIKTIILPNNTITQNEEIIVSVDKANLKDIVSTDNAGNTAITNINIDEGENIEPDTNNGNDNIANNNGNSNSNGDITNNNVSNSNNENNSNGNNNNDTNPLHTIDTNKPYDSEPTAEIIDENKVLDDETNTAINEKKSKFNTLPLFSIIIIVNIFTFIYLLFVTEKQKETNKE